MKRFFSLLLCLCLLLGGCGSEGLTLSSTDPESTLPSEEETIPADVSVQTDYSQYAPRVTLAPLYTPAEEPCYDLVASENYGGIYPYVGASVSTQFSGKRYYYGLTDARGRILTEPVYHSVELLQDWDSYEYTGRSLPFWVLQKQDVTEDFAYSTRYALATLDGSMVTECVYSSISWGDGYVVAIDKRGQHPRFDLFDTEGQLYLRSEDLPILAQLPENYFDYFYADLSDGMLRLQCGAENGQTLYYYTDLQGSLLLGPYEYAEPFFDGIAAVQDSYDTYCYIDRTGNTCFPLSFTYSDGFHEGVTIVADRDGRRSLVDQQGNVLLSETTWQTLYRERDIYGLEENSVVDFYNSRGELLYEDIPYHWSYLGRGIFSDWERELIEGDTQRRLTISDSYHYPEPLWDYGFDGIIVSDYSGEETVSYLVSEELELLERIRGTITVLPGIDASLLLLHEGQHLRFCDAELKPLFSCTLPSDGYLSVSLCNDRILIYCERYCLQYSLSGELLFCYLLPGFGGD